MTYELGQMMFNQRVLQLAVDSKDMNKKVFFSKIFMGNSDELYGRLTHDKAIHPMMETKVYQKYIEGISRITVCMNNVISNLKAMPGINFSEENSFEERLIMHGLMKEYSKSIKITIDGLHSFPWESDKIYFITYVNDKLVYITTLESSFYEKPIMITKEDEVVYFHTIPCVLRALQNAIGHPAIAFKPSIANNESMMKIEHFHNHWIQMDDTLIKIVDNTPRHQACILVYNEYMNVDYLEAIVDKHCSNKIKMGSTYGHSPEFQTLDEAMEKDRLIEYPQSSFDHYLQLLAMAAVDDRVKSISVTLYRIGNNPALFYVLRDALRRGVEVNVNIETEARGDEAINRFWEREMKEAGMNVTSYGQGMYKVHPKLTLIEMKDGKLLSHIGTGNYHWKTTTEYTDLAYMTTEPETGKDLQRIFNLFSVNAPIHEFDSSFQTMLAPVNVRGRLTYQIREQGDLGAKGKIYIKVNSLMDETVILELGLAAARGCEIHLIVRGACGFIPKPEWNVDVRSVVWDHLEHSRVYVFGDNVYIGSMDLMKKKMDERIELLVKISDSEIREQVMDYLQNYLTWKDHSWKMIVDGEKIEYLKER